MNDDTAESLGKDVKLASPDVDILTLGESEVLLDVDTRALPDGEGENEEDPEVLLLALSDDVVEIVFESRGDAVELRDRKFDVDCLDEAELDFETAGLPDDDSEPTERVARGERDGDNDMSGERVVVELLDKMEDCVAFLLGIGESEITLDGLLSGIDIVDSGEMEREAIFECEGNAVLLSENTDDTVMYAVFVATLVTVTALVEEEETEIVGVTVLHIVADGKVETDTYAVDDKETRALVEAKTDMVSNDEIDTTTVAEMEEVPIFDCVNAVEADGCDDALLDGDD